MTLPANIVGAKDYLALVAESTWGTTPGSPTWVHIPVESYGVKFEAENRQAKPLTGVLDHKHNRNIKGMPKGGLTTPLFGWHPATLQGSTAGTLATSHAEYLMTWLFGNPGAIVLPSQSAFYAKGPNLANQLDKGLRVNQATLAGSFENGISLSADVMGHDQLGNAEIGNAPALPNSRCRLVEFLMEHVVCNFDGSDIPIGAFNWQAQRALKEAYYTAVGGSNAFRPGVLRATDFASTISLTRPKEDDVWAEALRDMDPEDSHHLILTLKGLHKGTGAVDTNWTQVVLDYPAISFVTHEVSGGRELNDETLNFVILKPDTSGASYTQTWTDEA